MRRLSMSLTAVVLVLASLLAVARPDAGAAAPTGASRFVAAGPVRVLDTRNGIGVPAGIVAPGGVVQLSVAGKGVVPANATAVVLNVTVTDATGPGYVQVFPTGAATLGNFSNVNVAAAGQTIPNLAVVPIINGSSLSFFVQGGGHVLADLFGYFVAADSASGGRFQAINSSRLLDTRTIPGGKLGANEAVQVGVVGQHGVPSSGVSAVVLNVTATEATAPGFVQVIPGQQLDQIGKSSNLNLTYAGQTMPNLVIVPVDPSGSVVIYSQSGTHLLVDVLGYFTDDSVPVASDGLFVPVQTPARRILDTRTGPRPAAGSTTPVAPLGQLDIPTSGVSAVLGNITATNAMPGWVQALPDGRTDLIGKYSNVNVDQADQTIANAAIAKVGDHGGIDLYTSSSTDLLVDAAGYFTTAPLAPAGPPLSAQVTSPAAGVLRGNTSITASTTGNGVLGVQFKVDGANVGSEATTAPYSTQWVSASLPNGTHTITAVVRTAAATATSAPVTVNVSNALVTLTFDDSWGSQVAAAQTMNARGMKGTFYVLSGPISEQYPYPYMSVLDAQSLLAAGNEIGSHTVDHCSLTATSNPGCQNNRTTGLSQAEVIAELQNSKTALAGWGLGPINAFASPYGDMNSTVLPEVKSRYTTHRGIEPGINYPGPSSLPAYFDPYMLKTYSVFGANGTEAGHVTTTEADVQSWMNDVKAAQLVASQPGVNNTAWALLMFHEVTSTPASGSMEYSVTPQNFARFLDIIQASGVRVVTVQQALVESGYLH